MLCEEEHSGRVKNWIRSYWISQEDNIGREADSLECPQENWADQTCEECC